MEGENHCGSTNEPEYQSSSQRTNSPYVISRQALQLTKPRQIIFKGTVCPSDPYCKPVGKIVPKYLLKVCNTAPISFLSSTH